MKLEELASQADEQHLTSFYISFSDLMVLLGVFFVMLLSMSQIDTGSFEKIKTGFTGSKAGTLVELSDQLREIVEGVPGVPGVKVQMAEDGVRLHLDSGELFAVGSANLHEPALDPLKPLLSIVRKSKYTIDVEGHTDDLPMYRYYKIDKERVLETNWSLSGKRAASVVHFLLQLGFNSKRIRLVGYASNKPVNTPEGKTGEALKQARSENRRVTILIK